MAGPNVYDNILSGTFANPAMQTQGWGAPEPPAMRAQASRAPAWTSNGPALFQIGQELARSPATRYAVDGSGQRVDPIPLGYGSSTQSPAVTAATQLGQGVAPPFPASVDDRLNARANAANRAWLEAQAGQPGGIRPPWTIPQPPQGANPGMGGAIIGDGRMNPGIAPQGPPPPGIAPTVWAGDPPQQPGGPLAINVRGGQQAPALTPAQRYALANQTGQINAQQRQANATGTAGGYQYQSGQRVGYAPQTIGNQVYTPTNPATAYALANAAGQINALNRQATATGQTGAYIYDHGVRTGTVGGVSPSQAYAAANAGPGSVAAMEAMHAGGGGTGGGGSPSLLGSEPSRNPQKSFW